MGFYQRGIVPRLIDLAMGDDRLDAYRRRTIGAASGLVLEIGVGSGQNLPLYGSAVHRVYAIDPSMELLHMARYGEEQDCRSAPTGVADQSIGGANPLRQRDL